MVDALSFSVALSFNYIRNLFHVKYPFHLWLKCHRLSETKSVRWMSVYQKRFSNIWVTEVQYIVYKYKTEIFEKSCNFDKIVTIDLNIVKVCVCLTT